MVCGAGGTEQDVRESDMSRFTRKGNVSAEPCVFPPWFRTLVVVLLLTGNASSEATTSPVALSPPVDSIEATPPPTVKRTTILANTGIYYWMNITVVVSGEGKSEADLRDWIYQLYNEGLKSCVSSYLTALLRSGIGASGVQLVQGVEVRCHNSTGIKKSPCYLMIWVERTVHPCCLLKTLCQAGNATHNISATALTVVRIKNMAACSNDSTPIPSGCTATPPNSTTCEHPGTIFGPSKSQESNCSGPTVTVKPKDVFYSMDVTVSGDKNSESDVRFWLQEFFKYNLDGCVSSNYTQPNYTTSSPVYDNMTTTTTITTTATTAAMPSFKSVAPTHLFWSLDVSCVNKTGIRRTKCIVMLSVQQAVQPCCLLRAFCLAGNHTYNISATALTVERIVGLKTANGSSECSNVSSPFPDTCKASPPDNTTTCRDPGTVFNPWSSREPDCATAEGNRMACNCSAYCDGTDAYYAFQISIKDQTLNVSYIYNLISQLGTPCHLNDSNSPCQMPEVATSYKDSSVDCGQNTNKLDRCHVILGFSRVLPVCGVSSALSRVLSAEEGVRYDGPLSRAALCGNATYTDNPLTGRYRWYDLTVTAAQFCLPGITNILDCKLGDNVCVLLMDKCEKPPSVVTTTPPPLQNTTVPANTTSDLLNTTASPLNTTASPLNTTSDLLNTTASPLNTTSDLLNTTASPLNTTSDLVSTTSSSFVNITSITDPNVAVTAETNTSTTESPTTQMSAEAAANRLLELSSNVSRLDSSQVEELVSQLEGLLAGPNVSLVLGNISVHIVSNLLGASPDTVASSANRIQGIVDTVGLKLVVQTDPVILLSNTLALSVKPVDGANFQETVFTITDPTNVQVRGSRSRSSRELRASEFQGSIQLPQNLTQQLSSEQQGQASRVQFNFYQKSTVFQDSSLGTRRLISGILGASVANLSIAGLQENVIVNLRNTEPIPGNYVAICVFWDITFNDGSGGWNSDGCSLKNSSDKETVCSCNHLTSFAILLGLSREPLTDRLQATILTYITYIGCGLSAIFLAFTLLTYLLFEKLRKDVPSKILIQLCLALLLLNLTFLVDSWLSLYPGANGLCISTAWFLHYFLLASFTWMGLEAVHMYLALVKVFNTYVPRYMLKFSLIGWGVPMVVVIIVISVSKDNYGLVTYSRFSDGTTGDFCWLKNDIAFYVAVVAYFLVIFLFNLIMFVVVMVQLCRILKQNPHSTQNHSTVQDLRRVAGITVLLGLTWSFAFFAWGPVTTAFMYLFSIFNTLQGFFIFVFHCAMRENVRRQWRTHLCCGKLRLAENSDWSRTATQKIRKSPVSRLTSMSSAQSDASNNSSLVEPPGQLQGIGNAVDDREITADEAIRDEADQDPGHPHSS